MWILSNYLEKRPARIVIDKETEQELKLHNQHYLFVPLRYWPAILVLAGVGFMILG